MKRLVNESAKVITDDSPDSEFKYKFELPDDEPSDITRVYQEDEILKTKYVQY